LHSALQQPVVRNLCALIRLRNAHPAFGGQFSCDGTTDTELVMQWRNGAERAELRADFRSRTGRLVMTESGRPRSLDLTELASASPRA
jgi:sucrose phosphorylase